MTRPAFLAVLATACCLGGACKENTPPSKGGAGPKSVIERVQKEKSAPRLPVLGERRISGDPQDLRATPDGEVLTALIDAQKPNIQGAPPPMRLGELWAVPTLKGDAVKLGHGVTNMPGGWLFSPDSRWILFLAAWDPTQQLGELYVQDAKNLAAERQRLAARVTYFVPSDDSKQLAFVENGVLHVGALPAGPFRQVAGEVSTAEFSADGRYLYFRRRYSAAGGLFQVTLADERAQPKRLLDQVAEYTVLRSGKHVVVNARATPGDRTFQLHAIAVASLDDHKLSDDAERFRVTPDGQFVAWIATGGGVSQMGELWLAPISGKGRKLADKVKDFEFSPDSKRLVFRDNYVELPLGGREAKVGDEKVEKVGDLMLVDLPDGAPRKLQRLCPNYLFSPDGAALAYTARIEKPEVTRRLLLLKPGATEAVALKDWLYEYAFRPGGNELVFRADCLREGRACDVLRVKLDAPKDELPKKELEGVYSFKFSKDGSRAMVAYAHLTDQTFDLALRNLSTGEQKTVDQYVEWPAVSLGADGAYVAYLVKEKQRAGVYVAKTP
ncbi:MAG: gliding motility protein [Myxococcota bacterium]